jgi:hypothetical protein
VYPRKHKKSKKQFYNTTPTKGLQAGCRLEIGAPSCPHMVHVVVLQPYCPKHEARCMAIEQAAFHDFFPFSSLELLVMGENVRITATAYALAIARLGGSAGPCWTITQPYEAVIPAARRFPKVLRIFWPAENEPSKRDVWCVILRHKQILKKSIYLSALKLHSFSVQQVFLRGWRLLRMAVRLLFFRSRRSSGRVAVAAAAAAAAARACTTVERRS